MATLLLQDGTRIRGRSFGAAVDTDGEVVFSTGMAGYPESMTDPSFRGQILTCTYPLIGNYGIPSEQQNNQGFSEFMESEKVQVSGLIVQQLSSVHSHHAAVSSLSNWMEHHGIPGITDIDTRALTKRLREKGVMLGRIIQDDSAAMSDERLVNYIEDPYSRNLVAEVSIDNIMIYEPESGAQTEARSPELTIIAYDCGMKRNIIRSFLKRGVRVVRVPWNYDLSQHQGSYQGVFVSNGPGNPEQCEETILNVAWSMEQNIPTFGICLGNQILALAAGAKTFKLPYGHRGLNQPCVQKSSSNISSMEGTKHKCMITSQNHGYAVDADSLPQGWHVWFENANDGTVEGIRHESGTFFSVQFHPEASPGPQDAAELFDEFIQVMRST